MGLHGSETVRSASPVAAGDAERVGSTVAAASAVSSDATRGDPAAAEAGRLLTAPGSEDVLEVAMVVTCSAALDLAVDEAGSG